MTKKKIILTTVLILLLVLAFTFLAWGLRAVHMTERGDKYHKEDCRYVVGTNYTSMTVFEAYFKGHRACSVCRA